jgi:hypothetical protein
MHNRQAGVSSTIYVAVPTDRHGYKHHLCGSACIQVCTGLAQVCLSHATRGPMGGHHSLDFISSSKTVIWFACRKVRPLPSDGSRLLALGACRVTLGRMQIGRLSCCLQRSNLGFKQNAIARWVKFDGCSWGVPNFPIACVLAVLPLTHRRSLHPAFRQCPRAILFKIPSTFTGASLRPCQTFVVMRGVSNKALQHLLEEVLRLKQAEKEQQRLHQQRAAMERSKRNLGGACCYEAPDWASSGPQWREFSGLELEYQANMGPAACQRIPSVQCSEEPAPCQGQIYHLPFAKGANYQAFYFRCAQAVAGVQQLHSLAMVLDS